MNPFHLLLLNDSFYYDNYHISQKKGKYILKYRNGIILNNFIININFIKLNNLYIAKLTVSKLENIDKIWVHYLKIENSQILLFQLETKLLIIQSDIFPNEVFSEIKFKDLKGHDNEILNLGVTKSYHISKGPDKSLGEGTLLVMKWMMIFKNDLGSFILKYINSQFICTEVIIFYEKELKIEN